MWYKTIENQNYIKFYFEHFFTFIFQIAVVQDSVSNLSQLQQEYGITDDFVYRLGEQEFVIPGFIDTHIHAPQYPNAGLGYDKQLLDWLQTYTFPLESKYTDLNFATKVYEAIVVSISFLRFDISVPFYLNCNKFIFYLLLPAFCGIQNRNAGEQCDFH